jgi:hypothetical protein
MWVMITLKLCRVKTGNIYLALLDDLAIQRKKRRAKKLYNGAL